MKHGINSEPPSSYFLVIIMTLPQQAGAELGQAQPKLGFRLRPARIAAVQT